MNNIEVAVLDSAHDPGGMMMFLAKLTQRGHNIQCMDDLMALYEASYDPSPNIIKSVAALPHGTIKRFTPITIAIVGASRRFLAQARTHQIGMNFVSASLQYSDYTDKAGFVVPYALMEADHKNPKLGLVNYYLGSCEDAMDAYKSIAVDTDNDTAGYAAPQGLRNILIMQGNHQSWDYFIRTRGCHRNTVETQYVTMRIWEKLLNTNDGPEMFAHTGPDCVFGTCREGKMCCKDPMRSLRHEAKELGISLPRHIINTKWPLLKEDK